MHVTRADLWACQLRIAIKGNAGIIKTHLHMYWLWVGTRNRSRWKLVRGLFHFVANYGDLFM